MTTVSIIGTAGRGTPLTKPMYVWMVNQAVDYCRKISGPLILVSGGAAWSDHVAVHLYINRLHYELPIVGLRLYLPSKFNLISKRFENDRAGGISNYYHNKFNQVMNNSSYEELTGAMNDGAQVEVYAGFHARNSKVAQSQYLLAFTFGDQEPTDGGTRDTWVKASKYAIRTHISLKNY